MIVNVPVHFVIYSLWITITIILLVMTCRVKHVKLCSINRFFSKTLDFKIHVFTIETIENAERRNSLQLLTTAQD